MKQSATGSPEWKNNFNCQYQIMLEGKPVGGVIIKVEGNRGDLDILFCIRLLLKRLPSNRKGA